MDNFWKQTITGSKGNCFSANLATVLDMNIDDVPNFGHITKSEDFWSAVNEFLNTKGYGVFTISFSQKWLKKQKGMFLVAGKSPRGFQHSVIYEGGKIIHDPAPEGGGVEPKYIDIIYPIFEKEKPHDRP